MACKSLFLYYPTNKIVRIENIYLTLFYRILQALCVGFLIGYGVKLNKNQDVDDGIASVSTATLKGTYAIYKNIPPPLYKFEVYDSAGYVASPKEDGGFFIITNKEVTANQTQSVCPEDPRFKKNECKKDAQCLPPLAPVHNGNGLRTGKCVQSDRPNITHRVCEIYAWCPIEKDINNDSPPLLDEAKALSAFIKIDIIFGKFNYERRSNVLETNGPDYLMNCVYDSETDPFCPIFKIEDLVQEAGYELENVAHSGAIFGVFVEWDCDLDEVPSKCIPAYKIKRLDNPNDRLASGFNYRVANYSFVNNKQYRTLTKTYGLKFQIIVTGKGRKKDFYTTIVFLGATLALLSKVAVFFEWIVLFVCSCKKNKEKFDKCKYKTFNEENV